MQGSNLENPSPVRNPLPGVSVGNPKLINSAGSGAIFWEILTRVWPALPPQPKAPLHQRAARSAANGYNLTARARLPKRHIARSITNRRHRMSKMSVALLLFVAALAGGVSTAKALEPLPFVEIPLYLGEQKLSLPVFEGATYAPLPGPACNSNLPRVSDI